MEENTGSSTSAFCHCDVPFLISLDITTTSLSTARKLIFDRKIVRLCPLAGVWSLECAVQNGQRSPKPSQTRWKVLLLRYEAFAKPLDDQPPDTDPARLLLSADHEEEKCYRKRVRVRQETDGLDASA